MLLMLDDYHKQHLEFLNSVSTDVVREFCRISMEFIKKGTNVKMYQTAAQKLGVEAGTVQSSVEGLMQLFTEACKHKLSDVDYRESVMTLGFSEDLTEELCQQYLANRDDIRQILSEMSMDLPHYHNLEWRFDIQLASRSLHHQVEPLILLKLHTEDSGQRQSHVLQTDPVNLFHLTQTLEAALEEMKTSHCRRIVRNI